MSRGTKLIPPDDRAWRVRLPALRTRDALPHCRHDRAVIRMLEDAGTGDEHVGAGLGRVADVVELDAAIDLHVKRQPALLERSADFAQLVQALRNELLSAKSGMDAHH